MLTDVVLDHSKENAHFPVITGHKTSGQQREVNMYSHLLITFH